MKTISLLGYIYAETKAKLEYQGHYHYNQPATIIYYRDIDHNRLLTPKLLELAHMFQFEELEQDCIQHLKGHITDANAMEVWAVANLIQSRALKEAVFEKLIHRSQEKPISDVPGVERLIGSNGMNTLEYSNFSTFNFMLKPSNDLHPFWAKDCNIQF